MNKLPSGKSQVVTPAKPPAVVSPEEDKDTVVVVAGAAPAEQEQEPEEIQEEIPLKKKRMYRYRLPDGGIGLTNIAALLPEGFETEQ